MKIEAFVMVQPGCTPFVADKPWSLSNGYSKEAVWYRLTAEVPDPVPYVDVMTEVNKVTING